MARNQPKGTKKANAVVSEEAIDNFNAIFRNILKAWNLIPSLSPDSIGKLHDDVAKICANINRNYDKDNVFKLLQYVAKIPYHVEEGLRFNLTNKLERSFENYKEANHFCNFTLGEFQKIRNTMHKEFISVFPIFEFLECCRSITAILKEDSFKKLEHKKNQEEKFIDLAGWFRKIHTTLVRVDNKNLKEELDKIQELGQRVLDMYKEKTQEIDGVQIPFMKPTSNKVFIVHGHNANILDELKEFLENQYGIKPVVLYIEHDKGKVIIEKFEREAVSSCFAFVIMTKDDSIIKGKEIYEQGRPNVFFELGWFCGRYGRERVRILREKGAEIPSDLSGILTLNFIKSLKEEAIFKSIRKDLEHIGIEPVIDDEYTATPKQSKPAKPRSSKSSAGKSKARKRSFI